LKRSAALLLFVAVMTGCASSKPVDLDQPRRVVGTENDVRIDAEIFGDRMNSSTPVALKYDITNARPTPILVADLIPETTYDAETGVVTVGIGTEVPGEEFLPRLILINPGEKKSFTAAAHVRVAASNTSLVRMLAPNALRVKVNFLGDPKPFEKLIGIPERAIHDPQYANDIFTKWVEGNETVVTNALPMRWGASVNPEEPLPQPPARRTGRRAPPTPVP